MGAPPATLRILQVSSGLDPLTGGTATAAVSVALAARRAGLSVTLAYPHAPDAAERLMPDLARLHAAGVETRGFAFAGFNPGLAARWAIAPALDRYVRTHAGDFDVIHAHSTWVASSVAAVRTARRAKKPIVLMPHEALTRFDMARGRNAGLRAAKRVLRRWYLARLDRIILSSDLERTDSELDDHPGAVTIPHPVLDETLQAPMTARPQHAGLHLGFLGRFDGKKNLHVLVRALADAPGVRLSIGGGGDPTYRASIEALIARHDLADRIAWLGFIGAEAKRAFFADVDAVVMPSAFECFGLVAAEALGAGTPVVVSPTVGVADMIADRDCGAIVPPRADALAACFRRLADGVELARWRANARPTALALFSYAAHGTALRAVYQELAARTGKAPR